jgi:hypothetical protein
MQRMAAGRRIPARWQALVLVLIALASLVPTRPAAAAPEGESRDTTLQIGESRIEVRFADGEFALGSKRILEWVENSARIVAGYYGRFPVSRVRLQIEPRGGRGIGPGSSYGPGNALVRVGVGQNVAEMQLQRDWILIHEFVHLAFPWLSSEHSWLEEGLATYVEPVARAQGGQMSNEGVWEDLFGGLPKGLPRSGDRGLDRTPTWGRTYWGGALFCLLADVEIRRRTDNRFGLQDALRGVLEHGGSIEVAWPIRKALKAADDAVGVPVLTELYEQMRATPVDTDLEALARKLGIERTGDAIVLDDEAPDAPLRDAITAPVTPTKPAPDLDASRPRTPTLPERGSPPRHAMLMELDDPDEIDRFLRPAAALHVYELGDLDPFFWGSTRWFGWKLDGLQAVCLLYPGADLPTLLALLEPAALLRARCQSDAHTFATMPRSHRCAGSVSTEPCHTMPTLLAGSRMGGSKIARDTSARRERRRAG